MITRRRSLQVFAAGMASPLIAGCQSGPATAEDGRAGSDLKLSLGQWSLHRTLFGQSWHELAAQYSMSDLADGLRYRHGEIVAGPLDPLDFAPFTRETFGINAVEDVNAFYFDKAGNDAYAAKLDRQAKDAGVESVLVMCDALGDLGAPVEADRMAVIDNHVAWLDFASALDCKAIRVNAQSDTSLSREEQSLLTSDGLRALCERAEAYGLYILVENHGGLSSDGAWLAETIRRVDHPLIGTLPDFGNFKVSPDHRYDPYKGVSELMPFARGVSAKAYDFDPETGLETNLDYERLLRIVRESGFSGHIGIEYEGYGLSEVDGILATKRLIERIYAS